MRGLFLIIWLFCLPVHLQSQLYTVSDHYVHSSLAINPAYSGSQDALDATFLYRNSWVGFEGAPKTLSLAVHTPLNNERIGLGFFLMNDQIGINGETSFIGNYAYRMNLGYGKLALGLAMGMLYQNTSWNNLQALDNDDDELAKDFSSGLMPDFSFGMYYNTRKYFLGFSIPLFLSHEYNVKTGKYKVKHNFKEYNYFFTAGYLLEIDQNIQFLPSFLARYKNPKESQIDLNTQLILKNRFWLGVSYRSKNIGSGMLQFQINNQLRIAYSYDFVMGSEMLYKHNAHEIMLNYVFNYNVEVAGPRHF